MKNIRETTLTNHIYIGGHKEISAMSSADRMSMTFYGDLFYHCLYAFKSSSRHFTISND